MAGTQDLDSDDASGEYVPLHEHAVPADEHLMRKRLRREGRRARTPPSMRPFIVDTDEVRIRTLYPATITKVTGCCIRRIELVTTI